MPCPALATAALGLGGSSHSPGEKRGLRDAPSPNPEAGFSPGPWVSSVGLFQTSSVPSPPFPAPEETQTPQGVSAFWKFGLCASLVSRPPGVRVGPAPSVTSGSPKLLKTTVLVYIRTILKMYLQKSSCLQSSLPY